MQVVAGYSLHTPLRCSLGRRSNAARRPRRCIYGDGGDEWNSPRRIPAPRAATSSRPHSNWRFIVARITRRRTYLTRLGSSYAICPRGMSAGKCSKWGSPNGAKSQRARCARGREVPNAAELQTTFNVVRDFALSGTSRPFEPPLRHASGAGLLRYKAAQGTGKEQSARHSSTVSRSCGIVSSTALVFVAMVNAQCGDRTAGPIRSRRSFVQLPRRESEAYAATDLLNDKPRGLRGAETPA